MPRGRRRTCQFHSQGNILFADRGSDDVYRHINVGACASLIPVIDIDYNKYKKYLLGKNI